MTVELLSIGDELLSGNTINRNAAFLAHRLGESGYLVARMMTLPDQKEPLVCALRAATSRAELVITTGGLGPTDDDRTREAIAEVAAAALETEKRAAADLSTRFQGDERITRRQADMPKGATALKNRLGTALGFAVEVGNCLVIALPGVPSEMELMLEEEALCLLKKRFPKQRETCALYFCLCSEYQFDEILQNIKRRDSQIDIGICPSYGTLAIYLKTSAARGAEAQSALAQAAMELKKPFSSYCFSTSSPSIARALQKELERKKKTLAVAESCTGGQLATRMTALPGISRVFEGGFVVYANALKEKALGVCSKTLKKHGAVSLATIVEMTKGVFQKTQADYALATSGVAGPDGGTRENPVGTVWVALGDREQDAVYTFCLHLPEKLGREKIMEVVTTRLLAQLWRYLAHGALPFQESS